MEISSNPTAKRVWIDLAQGEAHLGGLTLPVARAGAQGEIRVGEPQGAVLRPLRFLERSRTVMRALRTPDPVMSLSAETLELALVQPGEGDPVALQVLALHLAGAGAQTRDVSLSETALVVGRAGAWGLAQIEQAEAAFIDHLAEGLIADAYTSADAEHSPSAGRSPFALPPDHLGWTTILFTPSPQDELDSLRRDLAEELLRRGKTVAPAAQPSSSTPAGSDQDASRLVYRRQELSPSRRREEDSDLWPGDKVEISQREPTLSKQATPASRTEQSGRESPVGEAIPTGEGLSLRGEIQPQSSAGEEMASIAETPSHGIPQTSSQEVTSPEKAPVRADSSSASEQIDPDQIMASHTPSATRDAEERRSVTTGSPFEPFSPQTGWSLPPSPRAPSTRSAGAPDPALPGVYVEYPALQRMGGFSELPGAIVQADLYDLSKLDEIAEALAALLRDEADLRGIDP